MSRYRYPPSRIHSAGTQAINEPLRVVRIPMPSHKDGAWRTFTNCVYAGGTLLVPTYVEACPQVQQQALDTFRRLLPGWTIVGVDCSALIAQGGALHCITANVPAIGRQRRGG